MMENLKSQEQTQPAAPARKKRRLRLLRWLVYLLIVLGLLLVFTPLGDRYGRCLIRFDPLAKADYLVVLGGDFERPVEAAQLYREGWAPKLIISSWQDDADGLAQVAESFGVPRQDIILDRQPRRTADHPRTIAQLPGVKPPQRLIVVTSSYHTSRCGAVFKAHGFSDVIVRGPRWRVGGPLAPSFQSWFGRLRDLPEKTYECLAWAMYRLRGWA